jgi:hypothetical protein
MTMIHFHLFKLAYVWQLKHSRNGNPKWRFVAQSAKGAFLEFYTTADAGSASSCKLHGVAQSTLIKVAYHETPSGRLIADAWGLASQEEIAMWDAAVNRGQPGQASTITADSFVEWFEENVSDEECEAIGEQGVDCDLFDDYGGVEDFYDRFDEELWEIVLENEKSLAWAFEDDCDLCCLDGFKAAMVLRAADNLAAERFASITKQQQEAA